MGSQMRYRLCGANHAVCDCDDIVAQTCVAKLVGDYLDVIRWGVLTDHAEGGPGDQMAIGEAERYLHVTMRSFSSLENCERWSIECGCGGFIKLQR
jgi:hypothetical protein